MSLRGRSGPADEQPESVPQPTGDLGDGELARARRRQLDCQGYAVQPSTDLGCGLADGPEREVGKGGSGPLDEEPDRFAEK